MSENDALFVHGDDMTENPFTEFEPINIPHIELDRFTGPESEFE